MYLLNYILAIILIVGAASIYLTIAWGQEDGNVTVPAKTAPTPQIKVSPPSNVQTLPNPNFQYLPQKAYVNTFTPEVAPTTPTAVIGPLPATQTPVVQPVVAAAPSTSIGGMDIMGVLAMAGAAAAYVKGHFVGKKTEKVQDITRENSAAIVDSKVVEQEVARYMFNLDKAKAESLNDAPAIKLETLENNKKDATETATKA